MSTLDTASLTHKPIMVGEILELASEIPQGVHSYLDGTFGRGGHLRAVLEKFPETKALATDKDQDAIAHAQKAFSKEIQSGRLQILHTDYSTIQDWVSSGKTQLQSFDFILLDLGISSPQIDNPERGFSFISEGPLDMRMNRKDSVQASDIINTWPEDDLRRIFIEFGEVKSPGRVIRAIVEDRKSKPFQTTQDLASLIARVEGWKKKGQHPATQYFMALRIEVNGELDRLEESLKNCINLLNENGRLFVITFHSLEDRIVKQTFNEESTRGFFVNKRVIVPSAEEEKNNPRSRSAKLRVFQRSQLGAKPKTKTDKYAHKKGQ